MACGLVVLKEMNQEKYDLISKMGEEIRKGLRTVFDEEGINVFVGGVGSFFFIAWTDNEVIDHESSMTADRGLANLFNISMMNKGFFILGHPNVSTVQSKKEISSLFEASRTTIQEIKPIIKETAPHLLL
jgi:glutamate-1-semialdehyde aminotransferase